MSREGIKDKRKQSWVGFLVCKPLIDDMTIIKQVKCNEFIWLRSIIRKGVISILDVYICLLKAILSFYVLIWVSFGIL